MLFALRRSPELIRIARPSRCLRPLLLRSFTSLHTPRQSFADVAQQDDIMSEGKEAKKSGGGVTLKVPKGTRDWSGGDMLLRDEVLYVAANETRMDWTYR